MKELRVAYRCHFFNFTLYDLESVQRERERARFKGSHAYSYEERLQICPQYSAFTHPISTNKPILSTLTVGFFPSITQSASRKPNVHAGTGADRLVYVPENKTLQEEHKTLSYPHRNEEDNPHSCVLCDSPPSADATELSYHRQPTGRGTGRRFDEKTLTYF